MAEAPSTDQQRLAEQTAHDLASGRPDRPLSAISRVRWVTIIENVFQMMNEPTNSAIPAKAMSMVLKKPMSFFMSSAASWAACSP